MQAGYLRGRRLAFAVATTIMVAACTGPRPSWTPGSETAPPTAAPTTTASTAAPSAAPSATAAPSVAASLAPALLVTARDLSFTPRQLTADGRAAFTLELHNEGRIVHNLTIDELGVQVVVSPGATGSATLADVPAGSYTFYCSVSGHRQAGMFGTLTVK